MTLAALLERFPDAQPMREGYLVRCPGHPDRRASLSLREAGDRVLVYCFGGCPTERVLAAIGLSLPDLFLVPSRPCARRAGRGAPRDPVVATLVARARRTAAKVVPFRAAFEAADHAREAARAAATLRRRASAMGDTDAAWDLLVLAAELDREVQQAELLLAAASGERRRGR